MPTCTCERRQSPPLIGRLLAPSALYGLLIFSWLTIAAGLQRPDLDDTSPSRALPPQVVAAAHAVTGAAARRTLGPHSSNPRHTDAETGVDDVDLPDRNQTEVFPSCTMACEVCFREFRQGCLAYCVRGCDDYCEERLPKEDCEEGGGESLVDYELEAQKTKWVAKISFATALLDPRARLCRASGINGCPEKTRRPPVSATSPIYDPYRYGPEGKRPEPSPVADPSDARALSSGEGATGDEVQAAQSFGMRGSPVGLRFRHPAPI
mmetsp:Transcript_13108/g.30622  ORF Transcript_13108/g.30622 Transcript_13108/m.30622 type:complete len:265 (+) Transcript_13108:81-875(+)